MQNQRGALRASRLQNVARDQKKVNTTAGLLASNQNELLATPSMLSTVTDTHNQNGSQNDQQKSEINLLVDRNKSSLEASVGADFKKDQFYSVGDTHLTSQGKTPFCVLVTLKLNADLSLFLVFSLRCR